MEDKLSGIFNYFSLRARSFHAGLLCQSARFDSGEGQGYIHVLQSGTLRVKTTGKSALSLNEPSLIFYMNPTRHQLTPVTSDTNLVCASFDFGNGMNNPLFQALTEGVVLTLSEIPTLHASVQLLFSEAKSFHTGQQALLDRLFEVIIIQLLRELITRNQLKSGLLAGLADPRLARAIDVMHREPAQSWTLEDLAQVAGMSRASFATKFRDVVGITPGNYLNDWRIGIAQSLLRNGTSLQRIAEATGYANASALSRAFRAAVGTSPLKWKNQIQNAS